MLNTKDLSADHSQKIHSVLRIIIEARKISKNEGDYFLVPKSNFEEQGIQISEVEGILFKIEKEENGLASIIPHEIPYPFKEPTSLIDAPLDYFTESSKQRQQKHERDKKVYDEKWLKNIEVEIKDVDKFKNLIAKLNKIIPAEEKEYKYKNTTSIEEIICVKPKNDGSKFKVVINGNYLKSIESDKIIGSWDLLYRVANEGEGVYADKNYKSSLDLFNTNKNCKIYTQTGCKVTKILKKEGELITSETNVKIKSISEKEFTTKFNKQKTA